MTNKVLRTSTAMLMVLSLVQPSMLAAQVVQDGEEFPPGAICADNTDPPCGEGVELILPPESQPVDVAPAEAADPVDEVVPEEAPVEPPAEAPAEEAPAAEAPAEAPVIEAPAAEEPAPEAPAAEEPVAEEPVVEEPAPEAAPEEPAAEEPVTEAPAAEMPAAEEPTPDAPAAEEPAIEESAAEEPAIEEPAAEVPVVEESAAEVPAEASPDAAAADEAVAPPPVLEAGETTDGSLVTEGNAALLEAAQAAAAAIGLTAVDPADGEEGLAAAVAAALGATDDEDAAAGAAGTTEVVLTEDDTRQSSEDFATTASGRANAAASGDRSGLSNFEKAALAGLGILAVGALLNNRQDRVVANTGDRVVVQRGDNDYYILKDDDALLRQPGSRVRTETFDDGSTRTIVTRDDGSRIITIRDASGRVLRRVSEAPDGRRFTLIDDTLSYEPVRVETLPPPRAREVALVDDPLALRLAIERASASNIGRAFSLRQIRQIEQVRKLVPEIPVESVTFETGSAAIAPSQARNLARLGDLLLALIEDDPSEVFLVEGHTDAVGSASSNLALSDRRAESLALALTEYFGVPPENMVVQGYGESDLKVQTQEAERQNRRVVVRRITPLLVERVARN